MTATYGLDKIKHMYTDYITGFPWIDSTWKCFVVVHFHAANVAGKSQTDKTMTQS